ncbi:DNMT3B [Symbiodinium sp. CCMP2592]|nr:DNMT3B [Symbiodinium sp. CCMP2592]
MRVDWAKCTDYRWGRQGRMYQLHLPGPKLSASTFELRGYTLSKELASGVKAWPCFTTPAPTDEGRPAPKSARSRIDSGTRQRWIEAHRAFAPWHFQEFAMVKGPDGALETVPIHLKEQAHLLPPDYTSAAPTLRDQRRLLSNSWHRGVASFLLKIVLQFGAHPIAQVAPEGELISASRTKDFHCILRAAREQPLPMTRMRAPVGVEMHPPKDMWEHWVGSAHVVPAALLPPSVEPAIEMTLQRAAQVGPHLRDHREAVLAGLRDLVAELRAETDAWYNAVPAHVRSALHPPGKPRFQVLAFVRLLQDCGYEHASEIAESLAVGLPLLGKMPPSPGWRPRTDDTYRFPISLPAFAKVNREYIEHCLKKPRVDPEWRALLAEVSISAAPIEGPFEGPPDWPRKTVDAASVGLSKQPLPAGPVFAARAFSVCQTGADGSRKVRRCEDYRRSHHNSTIEAHDRPEHDDIEVYIQVLRLAKKLGLQPEIWCHDLADAYRAYPIRDPAEAYMLLNTLSGPTLWRHRVLPFGSSASVWHFGRLTDAMCRLVRTLLHICVLHYVDDLGGIQDSSDAASAFSAFSEFCDILGYRLKKSKAQPPDTVQKLLGVILEITAEGICVRADPKRIEKLSAQIQQVLRDDVLEPVVAAKLVGKLGFIQSTAFGRAGSAALRPIHARANSTRTGSVELNVGLRGALRAVVYTDAFFELGERTWKAGDPDIPTNVSFSSFVTYGHGSVSSGLLQRFCSRRAFISFLEIYAQIIAFCAHVDALPAFWIAYVDNQPGMVALQKGFGRDEQINAVLTGFWTLATQARWVPEFRWVPSALNIADPISRADYTVVQPSWRRLVSDGRALEAILLQLDQHNTSQFPALVRNLDWRWDPPFGGV